MDTWTEVMKLLLQNVMYIRDFVCDTTAMEGENADGEHNDMN